jgi:hypothetical protein
MALNAQVKFLKGVPRGTEAQGIITLFVTLPNGSERAVDAHEARFASSSPPLDVTLLLDTSGSMSPFQSMLRISTATLLRLLPVPLSSVRVLTFDNLATERKARTQLATAEVQADLVEWSRTLGVTNGSTNLYDALVKLRPTDTQHFVVLLSDGHANLGAKTSDKDLCATARASLSASAAPVLMSCIGFNEPDHLQMPLLNGLASLCDGTVHIVQTPEKVHEAFGDVIGDMVSVLAGNVCLDTKSINVCLDERFVTGGKLKGLHVRLGAPRHIPFRISAAGQVTLSFWDVLASKQASLTVDLPNPPEDQVLDWDVHEALLFSRAAELLEEVKAAKQSLRVHLALLGSCPRASFNSPVPYIGGTGAGGGLSPGLSNTDDPQDIHEPPSKRQAVVDTMRLSMVKAWVTARDELIADTWDPVKAKLVAFREEIATNPNKDTKRLSALSTQFLDLIAAEDHTDSIDDRADNLAFDLVHQRSGVRDAVAPLGALDFDLTPSQMASRMVSRTLSHRPDVSAASAAEMLHDTLAVDLSAGDSQGDA